MIVVDEDTGEILESGPKPGIIAFHELVRLKAWSDSSSRGPVIKVGLASRDSLGIFEKVTKRAAKRAGQRYASVWQDKDCVWSMPIDLWFAGANWAHQDGASVKFSLAPEDLERLRSMVEVGDDPYWLTLVQIDDDEKPIDQKKAEVMDTLKGGPKSKRAAMLTQDDTFLEYVRFRMAASQGAPEDDISPKQADQWLKEQCGIESKRELDHSDAAWDLFQTRVMSPFIRWGERERWQKGDSP